MSDDTTSNVPGPGDPTGSEQRAAAVSAYVDGEATADEVLVVESDASLLADVRRLRALKAGIRQVPELRPAHRDVLLAGALAEFDARHADVPPTPSRSGAGRWLAVAAAMVAVVGTAGLAVSLVTTSGSDDDGPNAADSHAAPTEAADNPLTPPAEVAGDTGTSARGETEDTAAVDLSTDEAASPAATSSDSMATRSAGTAFDAPEPLADDRAMVDWVLQVQDGNLSPESQGDIVCGREVLGVATYRDEEVVVAIERDLVVARDTGTCAQVLSTDAP